MKPELVEQILQFLGLIARDGNQLMLTRIEALKVMDQVFEYRKERFEASRETK